MAPPEIWVDVENTHEIAAAENRGALSDTWLRHLLRLINNGSVTDSLVHIEARAPARHVAPLYGSVTIQRLEYKPFPPGRGNIKVPTSSRGGALAAISLYAPCKRHTAWLQWAAWRLTWLLGPMILPGRKHCWRPPLPDDAWSQLVPRWREEFGRYDCIAVYERTQAERLGFIALLVNEGTPVAFIKIRARGLPALQAEADAHSAIWRSRPKSFSVPEPLILADVDEHCYFAVKPLPPRPHRMPDNPALGVISREIQAALADRPRPPEVPAHWRPMHGDFTPWNLRRLADHRLFLIDWEDAGWGPPGADELLYQATAAALGAAPPPRSGPREAANFWIERIKSRSADGERDRRLASRLLNMLEVVATERSPH